MSTSYYQRRRDPQPISQGWEIAAVVLGGALLGLGFAALAGLGLASALCGGGWVWPHGMTTIGQVLGRILQGQPGRGLPAAQRRLVASPGPVYACVAVTELLLVAAAVAVGVVIARYRRPGDALGGMAARGEAEQALGLSRLRAAKAIIRPDLYSRPTRGTPRSGT